MHRDGAVASLTRVASSCGLARCCVGAHTGVAEKHGDDYASDYLIDLIANKTVAFLDGWAARAGGGDGGEEAGTGQPFFAVAAVPAAHEPADPAPQYADYATGLKAGGGSTDGGGGRGGTQGERGRRRAPRTAAIVAGTRAEGSPPRHFPTRRRPGSHGGRSSDVAVRRGRTPRLVAPLSGTATARSSRRRARRRTTCRTRTTRATG